MTTLYEKIFVFVLVSVCPLDTQLTHVGELSTDRNVSTRLACREAGDGFLGCWLMYKGLAH